jgi:hypothetical protein
VTGSSDRMREAGVPSTGRVVTVLSEVCAPHRGYSWSHHSRSRATLRGSKAWAALGKIGKLGSSAAKGIIEAGAPAFGCTVHPLRLQAPRAAYAHKSPGQGDCTARESDVSSGPAPELGELREELDTERTRREMAESTLREGMAEEQRRREKAERERDELREELYALREAPEASEAAEEQQGRGRTDSDRVESPEAVHRSTGRSLWRKIFGG